MSSNPWTEEDIEWLKQNYSKKSIRDLMKHLKKEDDTIHNKASSLGLARKAKKLFLKNLYIKKPIKAKQKQEKTIVIKYVDLSKWVFMIKGIEHEKTP